MSTVATPAPTPGRRRRKSRLQRRQARLGWLLLLPALAVVACVAIYPLGKTVYQSFTNQEFLAGITPTKWVGLRNYRDLWHDTIFRDSVVLTVKFTAITVSFEFVLGLIIALVVNSNFKGRGLMRAVMLVPWAIPTVVAAKMWQWMLDDVFCVFFGNRPDTQTMAIYDQSTIVGDGHVGYGAAISVAIFLVIAIFVVIYVTFMRVTEE